MTPPSAQPLSPPPDIDRQMKQLDMDMLQLAPTETTPPSNSSNPLPSGCTEAPNGYAVAGGLAPGMTDMIYSTITSYLIKILFSRPSILDELIWEKLEVDGHSILHSNPQLTRNILQNPELFLHLTSPQMMQQIVSFPQLVPEFNQRSPFPIRIKDQEENMKEMLDALENEDNYNENEDNYNGSTFQEDSPSRNPIPLEVLVEWGDA